MKDKKIISVILNLYVAIVALTEVYNIFTHNFSYISIIVIISTFCLYLYYLKVRKEW